MAERGEKDRAMKAKLTEIIQVRAGMVVGVSSATDRMNRMAELAAELLIERDAELSAAREQVAERERESEALQGGMREIVIAVGRDPEADWHGIADDVAACRQDAARYQWARQQTGDKLMDIYLQMKDGVPESLDAVVDKAMSAQGPT